MALVGGAHAIACAQDLAVTGSRKGARAARDVGRATEDREGHVRGGRPLLREDERSGDDHARGQECDEQDAERLGAHVVTLRAHYARVIAEE